jgi:hypothetical protein
MEKENRFCIIKELKLKNGNVQHVILLDGGAEVLEFSTWEEADHIATLFETNSDSGYKYRVRKI